MVTVPLTEKCLCLLLMSSIHSPFHTFVCIVLFMLQETKIGFRKTKMPIQSYPDDREWELALNAKIIPKSNCQIKKPQTPKQINENKSH